MHLIVKSLLAGASVLFVSCGSPEPSETPSKSVLEKTEVAADMDLPTPRADVVTDRFARLALECVHREYPNKIGHVMNSDADAGTPRELHPVFYGCFDWHSSVHGHWLLVRILNTDPDTPYKDAIIAALSKNFADDAIAGELAYFQAPDRQSYERPYGTAWFLQLMTELEAADFPEANQWLASLEPLETEIVSTTKAWLPNLVYPIRLGTHNQSAFAFGLMLDWARSPRGDKALEAMLVEKTLGFHAADVNCPLAYEPSGEDFLSPCLMEADLMRRVQSPAEFAVWLTEFLPTIPENGAGDWLAPGVVLDASDGKLVHLDGVNLSRAWALEGIIAGLPASDPRIAALQAAADIHRETGIAAVSDEHYSGSHWLASFATYLETQRGISSE
jgi:hypothetical protein